MSLSVDKVQSYDQVLGGYSWSFTPNASKPQGILVYVVTYDANQVDTITGVSYGGQALTKIGATVHVNPADNVDGYGQAWYLPLNTLSGTQTVAVTKSATPSANSVSVMVVSYLTSNDETPIAIDSTGRYSGNGTDSHTGATINTSRNSHITAMAIEPNLSSVSNTSPFSPLVDVLEDDWGIRMSNYGQVPGISAPGVYVLGWTYTATTVWGELFVAVKQGRQTGTCGVAYKDTAYTNADISGTTVATLPSYAPGDLLFATGPLTSSAPTGWQSGTLSSNGHISFWRVADGTEGSTITWHGFAGPYTTAAAVVISSWTPDESLAGVVVFGSADRRFSIWSSTNDSSHPNLLTTKTANQWLSPSRTGTVSLMAHAYGYNGSDYTVATNEVDVEAFNAGLNGGLTKAVVVDAVMNTPDASVPSISFANVSQADWIIQVLLCFDALPDEGGAGFDEWWDVMGGTDFSSISSGVSLPDLTDVNDGIDTGVTTGTLVQWNGTEWVGVTAVDGGSP